MKAEQKGGSWSVGDTWIGGTVPSSSNGLHVQLDGNSDEDLGSVSSGAFQTNDVIGVDSGLGLPTLRVFGFLRAHDIANLHEVGLGALSDFRSPGRLEVHNIQNVDIIGTNGTNRGVRLGADLVVNHDLVNVNQLATALGAKYEIGHDVGSTLFNLQGGTVILDKPPKSIFGNEIDLHGNSDSPTGPKSLAATIELGGIHFDSADFVPTAPGSPNGEIQLKSKGVSVYELANVHGVSDVSAGTDPSTGYNYVTITSLLG